MVGGPNILHGHIRKLRLQCQPSVDYGNTVPDSLLLVPHDSLEKLMRISFASENSQRRALPLDASSLGIEWILK